MSIETNQDSFSNIGINEITPVAVKPVNLPKKLYATKHVQTEPMKLPEPKIIEIIREVQVVVEVPVVVEDKHIIIHDE